MRGCGGLLNRAPYRCERLPSYCPRVALPERACRRQQQLPGGLDVVNPAPMFCRAAGYRGRHDRRQPSEESTDRLVTDGDRSRRDDRYGHIRADRPGGCAPGRSGSDSVATDSRLRKRPCGAVLRGAGGVPAGARQCL